MYEAAGRFSGPVRSRRLSAPPSQNGYGEDGCPTWRAASVFVGRMLGGLAIGVASGTCTAWVAELTPNQDKSRASVLATGGNFVGLALGPLIAGVLARYAPWPVELSYAIYLALLALIAF